MLDYRKLACLVTLWALLALLFTQIALSQSEPVFSDGKVPINGNPITTHQLGTNAEDTKLIEKTDKVEKAVDTYTDGSERSNSRTADPSSDLKSEETGGLKADDRNEQNLEGDANGHDGKSQETFTEEAKEADLKVDKENTALGLTPAITFELIGLPFIFHKGASIGYVYSDEINLHAAYSEATYNLGVWGLNVAEIEAKRLLAKVLWFPMKKTFYLDLGLGQRDVVIILSDDTTSLAQSSAKNLDRLTIKQKLLTLGLGNLWSISEAWAFGVDWLEVSYPLGDSTITAPILDKENSGSAGPAVRKIFRILDHVPDVTMLRLSLGYSF